jgi:hypothetical protein
MDLGSLNCGRTAVVPGCVTAFSHGLVYTTTVHCHQRIKKQPISENHERINYEAGLSNQKESSSFEKIITLQHAELW